MSLKNDASQDESTTDNRDFLRPSETVHYSSRGYCMYCGSSIGLTDEHIVPYFLLGGHVADKSSCADCSSITKKFEDYLSQNTYYVLRYRLKFQSRSRQKRKNKLQDLFVTIQKNDREEKIRVTPEQYPPVVGYMVFDLPGILRGAPFDEGVQGIRTSFSNLAHLIRGDHIYGTVRQKSDMVAEMRLAAKIAHGFFFSLPLYGEYEPLLKDVILTGFFAHYFVGGTQSIHEDERGPREKIDASLVTFETVEINGDPSFIYLIARVDLLISFGGPSYLVVVGRRKKDDLYVTMDRLHGALPLPPPIPKGVSAPPAEFALHMTVSRVDQE